MARKPKYTKEDFIKEAVNKMLEPHKTNYDTILEYPVFYNGIWYPSKDVYEVENNNLVRKPGNPVEIAIQSDREKLTSEYNKLKETVDGEQLKKLEEKFNQDIIKIRVWHWYEYYTWTEEEQKEYEKWFIEECRKRFRMTKTAAKKEASWWMLRYGLRVVKK